MNTPKIQKSRRSLNDEEEATIQLALRCVGKGVPLNGRHLAEAASIVVSALPPERISRS